jgi:hypothetical protein
MTSSEEPEDSAKAGSDSPGDIPAERPASLDRLETLIGQWETDALFEAGFFGPGSSPITGRGRTTFEWLAGRYFLTQRFVNEHPAMPSGIAIIGAGADPETFEQNYYDSRGVARVYQMSLNGDVLKLWREAPGFWQRYTGVISTDGNTITGAWEASAEGRDWRHDFNVNYTKVN